MEGIGRISRVSKEELERRREELKHMVEKKLSKIEISGPLGSIWRKARKLFRTGAINEIRYDWGTVAGFAAKVKLRIINVGKDGYKNKDRYATVEAYLILAKLENDPGQAWNYVNSADKILPLIVDDEDFSRVLFRMSKWDEQLYKMDSTAKEGIQRLEASLGEMIDLWEGSY